MSDAAGFDSSPIAVANADPQRAWDTVLARLEDQLEPASRLLVLRAGGIAARLLNRHDDAMSYGQAAASLATELGDIEQVALSLLDQASALTVNGEVDEAGKRIEEAAALAKSPTVRGATHFQRGFAHTIRGEQSLAISEYEAAVDQLELSADRLTLRKSLQNLGGARLSTGDVDGAAEALSMALAIARSSNDSIALIGLSDQLGKVAAYRGDLPAALSILEDGDRQFMEYFNSSVPQHVTKSEVLTSAGLFREAKDAALAIGNERSRRGDHEHAAEALVVAARAALLDGQNDVAAQTASLASRYLLDGGRRIEAFLADMIWCDAEYALNGPSPELMTRSETVVAQLDEYGRHFDADEARMVAARVAIGAGDFEVSKRHLQQITVTKQGPLEQRLRVHLARALNRELSGDRPGAARAAAAGVRYIEKAQSQVGSTDLRLGMERHASALAEIGLRAAVSSRRPRRILSWFERSRAGALRFAPVTPVDDSESRTILANLRRVEARMRSRDNLIDAHLEREREHLQRDLSRRHRQLRTVDEARRVDVGELVESLGSLTLIEFGELDGSMFAVVVVRGRARFHQLGSTDDVARRARTIRFDMRRAARLGRSFQASSADSLQDQLLKGLGLGDGTVIISPLPEHMALPWSLLPSLRDRPVVVTPSAEMWWRASRRESDSERVVVAGGPDLDIADSEVEAVADLYDSPERFDPHDAKAEDVRDAMSGARVAHIAAHARFEVQNPMFSSLRLTDGDLNVYDLERIGDAPLTVVLSACDSGYTEARPGEELAGLTSALLSMGSRSIVASIGLVPDSEATKELMVNLHKGLVAGKSVPEALSLAQNKMRDTPEGMVSAASFIAVGA